MVEQSAHVTVFSPRKGRGARMWLTFGLVALGPVLVFFTFLALNPLGGSRDGDLLRLVLIIDICYILCVATLVLARLYNMIAARRAHSAGSKLHLRLSLVFSSVALGPTILVALFAVFTINLGLEGWFSDRVRLALGNSVDAAEAYAQEHRDDLIEDATALAEALNLAGRATRFLSDGDLRQLLGQGQERIQRGLSEAFIIDSSGEIRARGENSYLFDFEALTPDQLERLVAGDIVLVEDNEINEFRVALKLNAFVDRYLYVTRPVDGAILALLDETQQTVQLYRQLEAERGRLLFEFGLLYLGFALILILAAVWLGLWFAERLSRPVGRLAGAAQRVGHGDLDVHVQEETGDDEIAMLGRLFNQMTRQLKGQRDALIENNQRIEARRRLFDSVLSSVTAGVIGLDAEGRIDFLNKAASELLQVAVGEGEALAKAVPEFTELFDKLRHGRRSTVQGEVRVTRGEKEENLLVRLARRQSASGDLEGYVVAFDDVTDLVSAQRMAAWGDVARRIAHEIKNPLTPIRLSSERVKRKFAPMLGEEDAESLREYADVIARQTDDLRRIVDEFSKFARMPAPQKQIIDVAQLLRETVTLQKPALEPFALSHTIPDHELRLLVDPTMLGQAFTNLIKNAGEALISLQEAGWPEGHEGEVQVSLSATAEDITIRISDSGIGLPANRARLFEPYVTTRAAGTGLGLSIVKKIIEEHNGSLDLIDAPLMGANTHKGAEAVITLPALRDGGA